MTAPTILWHDYETWGVSPAKDYPCQFAALRTDMDLNVIGDPINIMSQIPNDYLPHPGACLVTGITPQHSLRDGMHEVDFAAQIFAHMSEPGTCVAGYNSIRFDDEVSRFLFFRNFYDPYAREWRNGNSRWDIIDLARACYALRPDGIEWPTNDHGTPTFKLELLTAANGLEHGQAHDALSDVRATIALAKLIKEKQPKLFDYAFSLRQKNTVLQQLDLSNHRPFLHVSSRIPAQQGCASWMVPISKHPNNPNAVICLDLSHPVEPLFDASAEHIQQLLYTPSTELGYGESRPGLKLIHINRSPFVTTAKAMSEENAMRLGLDRDACLARYQQLVERPELIQKLTAVYAIDSEFEREEPDVEQGLYSGDFWTDEERRWCNQVIEAHPEQLANLATETQNTRLKSLLFRYRARNFPHTLNAEETMKWQAHRQARLTDGDFGASITLVDYMLELENLTIEYADDTRKMRILKALYDYAKNL